MSHRFESSSSNQSRPTSFRELTLTAARHQAAGWHDGAALSHEDLRDQADTASADAATPDAGVFAIDDDATHTATLSGGDDGSTGGRARYHHPASVSSLSSLPAAADDHMSVNPAHEIAASLRSHASSLSLASERPPTYPDSPSTMASQHTQGSEAPELHPQQPTGPPGRTASMEGTLPENDGMHALRQKLQEIKRLAVSTEEKAKQMHALMMHDYVTRIGPLETETIPRQHAGPGCEEHGLDAAHSHTAAAAMPIDPRNPYNLRPGDLEPTISPIPSNPPDAEAGLDENMGDGVPDFGCMHYKRNVKIQCFDCHRWFPCRHCHDQAKDLPFEHSLNRKKTQNMLCMFCQTPQPAAEACAQCDNYAAWYYCSKCKLWDNDINKRIYHCDECSICRVGEGLGKDYVHCRRCNVCISIATSAAHPCIERATDGDCPLCLVHLFESRTPVVSLPCGHYMHGDCYKDLMAVTYKCPVCNKSAVNMELQWRKLDDEIAAQPMPEDDDLPAVSPHAEQNAEPQDTADQQAESDTSRQQRPRTVWTGCNDCGSRSWSPFHWLGLKCQRCDSYNTNQMPPTLGHETDAERMTRLQQNSHQHDLTGEAVLRDAGIGMEDVEQRADSALDVPKSPSQQPLLSTSPTGATGAHSPGRYFVRAEDLRQSSFHGPSFASPRFSAPSIPNLPTLSNLPDMPRMPRMPNLPNMPNLPHLPNLPNLPNLDNMRQNLPNLEFPRFSPYDVMEAVSRGLTPMRYYLQGLDSRDDAAAGPGKKARPTSVQSAPGRSLGSKLRPSSSGSATTVSAGLWDSGDDDTAEMQEGESGEDDSGGEEDDGEDVGLDGEIGGRGEEMELFGHR